MGVYIKNWSLANWKELLRWAKIGTNNAMIGEFTEVEEIQQHGRLIDADALTETTDGIWDCNDLYFQPNDKICDPNDCKGCKWRETMDCFRRMVKHAPTIIPASEES